MHVLYEKADKITLRDFLPGADLRQRQKSGSE
jgi:hypothetical protein